MGPCTHEGLPEAPLSERCRVLSSLQEHPGSDPASVIVARQG
jgi:hypothetical protein